MNDPLVHVTTGAPCKGKLAAKALAVLVLDPRAAAKLRKLRVLAQAEEALVPFGWPNREALAQKLEITMRSATVKTTYNVLVDVDTKEEHGAASYQARERFEEAKKEGRGFIEMTVAGVKRRVVVVTKEIARSDSTSRAARIITPDQAQERSHARARALESQARADGAAYAQRREVVPAVPAGAVQVKRAPDSDSDTSPASLMEASLDACWPHCHCSAPTPWALRKVDGPWDMDGSLYEQRTCLVCFATTSREIGR